MVMWRRRRREDKGWISDQSRCVYGGFLLPDAPEPGEEGFDHLLVGRRERGRLGRRGLARLFFDVLQNVEQHLGGPQIRRGGFVDQLNDDGFTLGDQTAASVLRDGDQLVQRLDQQRQQVFFSPAPRRLPDWPFSKRLCSGGFPGPTL